MGFGAGLDRCMNRWERRETVTPRCQKGIEPTKLSSAEDECPQFDHMAVNCLIFSFMT